MKLYFMPTTRAVRPRWLLEEMDIPYELIYVSMDMSRSPDYQKLHPHGKVPLLIDGDIKIFESAAICSYLTDKYSTKGFLPSIDSPERAYYYQWLFYAGVTLEPPVEQYMFNVLPGLPEKVLPPEARTRISREAALAWFARVCEPLNTHLQSHEYLVENRFTAADVIMGGVLLWAWKLKMLQTTSPVRDYICRLMERPALQRADEAAYGYDYAPPETLP